VVIFIYKITILREEEYGPIKARRKARTKDGEKKNKENRREAEKEGTQKAKKKNREWKKRKQQ
jgi:hypothetical protein